MADKWLHGVGVVKMLAQSDVYYWNYYPNISKTEPNGVSKQKKSIQKINSRTANTQSLKIMDPEVMSGWSYYRLCENLCGPFRLAPVGNLCSFWAQKMFFLLIK